MTAAANIESPRIALIVDNPLRDLSGLCLLAIELSRRGATVMLVPMYLNDEVFSLAPDMVVLNYMTDGVAGLVQAIGNNGMEFGVLDTEGGPCTDIEVRYKRSVCADRTLTKKARV